LKTIRVVYRTSMQCESENESEGFDFIFVGFRYSVRVGTGFV
jgi:hypothetical protein